MDGLNYNQCIIYQMKMYKVKLMTFKKKANI
jgi:hypothetical protein